MRLTLRPGRHTAADQSMLAGFLYNSEIDAKAFPWAREIQPDTDAIVAEPGMRSNELVVRAMIEECGRDHLLIKLIL